MGITVRVWCNECGEDIVDMEVGDSTHASKVVLDVLSELYNDGGYVRGGAHEAMTLCPQCYADIDKDEEV